MTPRLRITCRDFSLAAALAATAAAVYAPSVGYDFVNIDDHAYASANDRVLGGLTGENVVWALTTIEAANWHPLTWLSLQLDATFWGRDPAGYHLTNVLLHAANTALVYLVFVGATGAVGRSFVAAALFGLHPLHVESVAWVTERKDVLSGFFWLLTMAAYLRYASAPSRGRMALVALAYALGLTAKPMLVTLPFALLLFDYWPLGRFRRRLDPDRLVLEKAVLFLLVVASCAATFYAQTWGGAVRGLHELSLADRVSGSAIAYCVYLGSTAYPTDLMLFYGRPAIRPLWQPVGAVVALTALSAAAYILRRRAPYLLVGWFWFLGTLVPVIGLVQVGDQPYADRYTYLPHVGLFLAGAWGAAALANALRVPLPARAAAVAVALAACAAATHRQMGHWADSRALWERARDVDPDCIPAWILLGDLRAAAGEPDEAMRLYDVALRRQPDSLDALMHKSRILAKRGQW